MRLIVLAALDKRRPAVLLTREAVGPYLRRLTVAPITTTTAGLGTEVPVGPRNGLSQPGVVSCDNITTVAAHDVGRQIGFLLRDQEVELAEAMAIAFDLQ